MKNIIPVIIISASLLSGINYAYADKKTDSVSNLWEDSQSKAWGNTPESVKYVLSNVQISRNQSGQNNKQTDLFSTKWLKEMQRSPSTYRLTDDDKKWVDNVLANAEARKSNTWKPSNKNPTIPQKPKENKQNDVVKSVAIAESASIPKNNNPSGTGLTKEEVLGNTGNKKIEKAESKPLPMPKIETKEKPDLTPVPKKVEEAPKENKVEPTPTENKAESKNVEVKDNPDDEFIKSLPKITSEDLPRSEIEETRDEMSLIRENNLEKTIQSTLEKDELNNEDTKVPEVKLFNTEKNEIKPIENKEVSIENNNIKELNKNNDLKNVSPNIVVDKKILNNNDWIKSTLSSLVIITIFMFVVVMIFVRKMKNNGKLEKYI